MGSRVLDTLIKYAGFDTIVRFTESFSNVLRPFCSDRFASHVLQKLLSVCAHRGNLTESKAEDTVPVKETEIEKYNEIKSIKGTGKFFHVSARTIREILKNK